MAITTGVISAKLAPQRFRQQPQSAVEIDWAHPLARGLVFFQIPNAQAVPELVGGGKPVILGTTTTLEAGTHGRAIATASTNADGWVTPYQSDRLRSITTDFTIATRVDISAIMANSKIITLPLSSTEWTAPFASAQLSRSSSSSQIVLHVAAPTGTTRYNALFAANTFQVSTGNSYIATKSGATARLLYNRSWLTPDSSTLTTESARFSTGAEVALMNRMQAVPGEGIAGKMYYAAIWNRALSEAEARSFEANPYQILKPARQRLTFAADFDTTSATVTGTLPTFSSVATSSLTAPRTATSVATLPKFTTATTGSRGSPGRTATATGTLPKFTALAAAVRTIPARTATSAATLPKLSVTATASTSVSPRTATALGVLPKFGGSGIALRNSLDRAATSASTLPKFRSTVAATRTAPPSVTTSAATLPLLRALATAIRTVTPRIGVSSSGLPRLRASTSTVSLPPAGVIVPLTVNHRRAPSWRLADAGTGQTTLSFASALDPNGLTYFTIDWATELNGSSDTIILDKDAIGVSLSTSAIVAGLLIHAITFDETSITVWLKVHADQQSAEHWGGTGESYTMNFTVKTMNGQIFNRNVTVAIKQM